MSYGYCRAGTEQIKVEITQQSLQHVTDKDGDLGQEG